MFAVVSHGGEDAPLLGSCFLVQVAVVIIALEERPGPIWLVLVEPVLDRVKHCSVQGVDTLKL